MTAQHPIVPSLELIKQWRDEWYEADRNHVKISEYNYIANQAASWGADKELEACCKWFQDFYKNETWMLRDLEVFHFSRRSKPASLKKEALTLINSNKLDFDDIEISTICKALEALPDD
jgi:hypothetical protein